MVKGVKLSNLCFRRALEYEYEYGYGEMAQWLNTLDALPEDPGSGPHTHTVALNHL